MLEIIGIRFKEMGKIYYFDPNNINFRFGDLAIVETSKGLECGKVILLHKSIDDNNLASPLKKIIRKANDKDIEKLKQKKEKEKKAFNICLEKIAKHDLKMKLIDVEYAFDNNKILFYFTADGRVDFRELVKDLAAIFRTRIELRQIGVRDESKMLGGLGVCGKPFCCSSFLDDFQPVSIKMAKEQGLSLNPIKISGNCGRLMCCLKYEQDAYIYLLKSTPKIGAIVDTKEGRGTVVDLNLLTRTLSIKLDKAPESIPIKLHANEVKLIKDGKITIEKEELEILKGLE